MKTNLLIACVMEELCSVTPKRRQHHMSIFSLQKYEDIRYDYNRLFFP
jgi:hypothetical protein